MALASTRCGATKESRFSFLFGLIVAPLEDQVRKMFFLMVTETVMARPSARICSQATTRQLRCR